MRTTFRIPAVVAAPLLAGYALAYVLSAETITLRVEDKHTRIDYDQDEDGVSRWSTLYRVHTADEVFKIDPDPVFLEFAAAERYHALKVGRTYRVLVAGWRVPIAGTYRNIVKVVEEGTE